MKAAYLNGPGGPEAFVYGELDDPKPGPGEVLVRVRATTINHVDTVWRSGKRAYFKLNPPHILGSETAGEIAALGAGVTNFKVGDRVVAGAKSGSYAELALADARTTMALPDSVSFEHGASLMSTGMTAVRLVLRRAQPRAGDWVVVTAAASGTGAGVLQVAKAAGARVIGTAGGDRKGAFVRDLGADAVVDHYGNDVKEKVMEITEGKGVAAVIDAVSSQPLFDALIETVRPLGRWVIYGNIAGAELKFSARTIFMKGIEIRGGQGNDPALAPGERAQDAETMMRLAAAGQLRIPYDRVLPLSDIAEGHRVMDAHEMAGKIVIKP